MDIGTLLKETPVGDITRMQHELAIWEAAYAYLDDTFVSKDGREVKLIRVPDCLEEVVSEDTIDRVLQQMAEGPIKGLKDSILAAIGKLKTTGGTNEQERTEPATAEGQGSQEGSSSQA